jgi:DNA-binding NarL/FixJ family response regulator
MHLKRSFPQLMAINVLDNEQYHRSAYKNSLIEADVVLMDINLGESESGIDLVRELKPIMPATNFMMCTVYEDDEKIFEALSAGASGYILKKTEPQNYWKQ